MKIVKFIKSEYKYILLLSIGFAAAYFLPVGYPKFDNAVKESFELVKWYAREHVILCLIPAFYIAGAISAFVSSKSVMKYLGANANKLLAYSVASVSGAILTVCSCTVLPIFGGIWKMGAGLGPAIAFLYSGPAINVLAIILTARVLGIELGLARAIGAILFSIVIGLIMHLIYRKEEQVKAEAQMQIDESKVNRPLWQVAIYFAVMIAILIFANWGESPDTESFWYLIWKYKWRITAVSGLIFCYILIKWIKLKPLPVIILGAVTSIIALLFPDNPSVTFLVGSVGLGCILISSDGEAQEWGTSSYNFAKQIFPLLLIGVLITGFLFGKP
ncbi:MAG TPA: permease, partial [Verrucomicrobiota bacterium]|nr:permease [Verrucomicrobiota bacterium]